MAWTAEDRRKYAPAMQEVVRQGMLVRLATTIAMIAPPPPCGRRRIGSTLVMLQALGPLVRNDRAWRRRPSGIGLPPHPSVGSRLLRWRLHEVLERALSVVVACRRLAAGRRRWPRAASIDTQSVRTGPQGGPRGDDAAKTIKGRKRVLLVDTQGDLLGGRIVPADVQDREALHSLAPDLDRYARLLLVGLDRAFAGQKTAGISCAPRHQPRDRRHRRPPRVPDRAPTLEGRANLWLPAALASLAGR